MKLKKVTLSHPAMMASVSFLVLLSALGAVQVANNGITYNPRFFVTLLVLFVASCLCVYMINCMFVGECRMTSWAASGVVTALIVLFLLFLLLKHTSPSLDIGPVKIQVDEQHRS